MLSATTSAALFVYKTLFQVRFIIFNKNIILYTLDSGATKQFGMTHDGLYFI